MSELEKLKEYYKEIIDVLSKYKDACVYNVALLEHRAKEHLFGVELKEKYGLNIKPEDVHSFDYIKFSDCISIGWWGEKYNRTISWSDNASQPEDELLCVLSFSTGAYIFGDDYPQDLFLEFWRELKSYNPKYTDTNNRSLYFAIEKASKVFNDFPVIIKKYRERNLKDEKERKIKKLKEELVELEK